MPQLVCLAWLLCNGRRSQSVESRKLCVPFFENHSSLQHAPPILPTNTPLTSEFSYAATHQPTLSHRMYLLISLRKSTPPQNRQLIVENSSLKHEVDSFMGELTY